MKLLGIALILFGSAALAEAPKMYDIEMKYTKNGKLLSTPHIRVVAGEKASMKQTTPKGDGFFIDVTPSENKEMNGVMLSFAVGDIYADGRRKVTSTPQMILQQNSPGEITVTEDKTKESISMWAQVKEYKETSAQ